MPRTPILDTITEKAHTLDGARGPEPRGIQQWTASHCAFAKLGTRRGDFRASASNILCFGALAVQKRRVLGGIGATGVGVCAGGSVSHWRVRTQAERDVAVDCLALRIREIGPSTQRFPCQRLEYPLFWCTRRQKWRVLGAWGPTPSGVGSWTASRCAFA